MLIERISPFTGVHHKLEIDVTQEQLDNWRNGELIQRAMPHLSAHDREYIRIGVTEQEWNEAFQEQ